MSKTCVKKGENPNIPHPQCERSIKISVFKQQRVPNTGTKNAENGGNWGKIRGKFARRARRANVLSMPHTNSGVPTTPTQRAHTPPGLTRVLGVRLSIMPKKFADSEGRDSRAPPGRERLSATGQSVPADHQLPWITTIPHQIDC